MCDRLSCRNKNLERLYLNGNNIDGISKVLLKLVNLQFLRLDQNCITEITNLEKLAKLEELDVSMNSLSGNCEKVCSVCSHDARTNLIRIRRRG
jgi:hypothetical protein